MKSTTHSFSTRVQFRGIQKGEHIHATLPKKSLSAKLFHVATEKRVLYYKDLHIANREIQEDKIGILLIYRVA